MQARGLTELQEPLQQEPNPQAQQSSILPVLPPAVPLRKLVLVFCGRRGVAPPVTPDTRRIQKLPAASSGGNEERGGGGGGGMTRCETKL